MTLSIPASTMAMLLLLGVPAVLVLALLTVSTVAAHRENAALRAMRHGREVPR